MPSPLRKQRALERKLGTRRRLLDAAAAEFADRGYHRTLVSDIVARAGVGQGTFYRFFDGKREVFAVMQAAFFDELVAQFAEMQTHPPTDLAGYRTASLDAVRRLVSVLSERRAIAQMIIREAPSIDREAEQTLAQLFDRLAEVAKYYLDRAMAQGFARRCDSAVVAQSLIGLGLRHMQRWFDGEYADADIDAVIREIVDFAFLGFAPRDGAPDEEG